MGKPTFLLMSIGVYQHKSNQGFRKGNKLGNKFGKGSQIWKRALLTHKSDCNCVRHKKVNWNEGKELSKEMKRNISESRKGKGLGNKNCVGRIPWNYKGGKGTLRHQEMGKWYYKEWRKAIFDRDNFTCQFCNQHGGNLHADHIKSWADFPELRFDINNGRTLCVSCHKTTDTYPQNLRGSPI